MPASGRGPSSARRHEKAVGCAKSGQDPMLASRDACDDGIGRHPEGMMMTKRRPPARDAVAITRILVPTDFSPGAEGALRWAATLADEFGAELIFLHGLDLSLAALAGLPSDVASFPGGVGRARLVRSEATGGMAAVASART